MTAQQFWMMKADQISDSWKTIEEKSEALAVLLKTAYKPKKTEQRSTRKESPAQIFLG